MSDKEFTEGIWYKDPHQNAPDFVIGALNIKRQDFMKFLAERDGDYVNLKILRSRAGKPYLEVDNWKPTNPEKPTVHAETAGSAGATPSPAENSHGAAPTEQSGASDFDDDIPF